MAEITIAEAILFIVPNSEFRIVGNDLSTLEFYKPKNQAIPTQAEIDLAVTQLQASKTQAELDKAAEKSALLARLGLTDAEAKLLLS